MFKNNVSQLIENAGTKGLFLGILATSNLCQASLRHQSTDLFVTSRPTLFLSNEKGKAARKLVSDPILKVLGARLRQCSTFLYGLKIRKTEYGGKVE